MMPNFTIVGITQDTVVVEVRGSREALRASLRQIIDACKKCAYGTSIQQAFDFLSDVEREFLTTGLPIGLQLKIDNLDSVV